MKTSAFLVLAVLAAAAVVAVPVLVEEPTREVAPLPPADPEAPGVLLRSEASSGAPCSIVVEPGLDTRVDRGAAPALSATKTFRGGFRYWEEPVGRVLYVYDDVQNLVSRIVNPRSVRVIQATATP